MGERVGRVFVVSGPSGVGKGSIIEGVRNRLDRIHFSVSATTRAPRPGEVNGINYEFLSEEEFRRMIAAGELLEWAEVFGNLYGTSTRQVDEAIARGEDVILEIDVQGAESVRRAMPKSVSIFVKPPDLETLTERLSRRGTDSPEIIERRVRDSVGELGREGDFDHVIVNDSLEEAVSQVVDIIESHRKVLPP